MMLLVPYFFHRFLGGTLEPLWTEPDLTFERPAHQNMLDDRLGLGSDFRWKQVELHQEIFCSGSPGKRGDGWTAR